MRLIVANNTTQSTSIILDSNITSDIEYVGIKRLLAFSGLEPNSVDLRVTASKCL